MSDNVPLYPKTPDEQQAFQERNPRLAWWLGLADTHPSYPQMRGGGRGQREDNYEEMTVQNGPVTAPVTAPRIANAGGTAQTQDHVAPAPTQVEQGPAPAQDLPEIAVLNPPPQSPPAQEIAPDYIRDSRDLLVSIPTGGGAERSEFKISTATPFDDFRRRVFDHLRGSGVQAVKIGYKYHKDKRREDPHPLDNIDQFKAAMECGYGLIKRAITREITLEIYDTSPPTAGEAPKAPEVAPAKSAQKRKAAAITENNDNNPPTTISFAAEHRQLCNRLKCSQHPGRYCYIHNRTGVHHGLEPSETTFWARKILLGEADYSEPPEVALFDRFRKNFKKPRPGTHVPKVMVSPELHPQVHLHISTPPALSLAGPSRTSNPLGDKLGQRRVNAVASSSSHVSKEEPGIKNEKDPLSEVAVKSWATAIDLTRSSPPPELASDVIDLSGSSPPTTHRRKTSEPIYSGVSHGVLLDARRLLPQYNFDNAAADLNSVGIFTEEDFYFEDQDLIMAVLGIDRNSAVILRDVARKSVRAARGASPL